MVSITELAKDQGFSGSKFHRFAELRTSKQYTVDESSSFQNNIQTSVDCYVSGTYIGSDGNTIEVKQRYTIYVSYSKDTQRIAMQKVRNMIIQDFEREFAQFHVTDVFIPEAKFIIPLGAEGKAESAEFYFGSDLFKKMSRLNVAKYKMATESAIYKSRKAQLKKRYGM